ncbi:MAG: hypothetical protein HQL49_06870 [Gammaproteobacteria bacterium]|nr:hypothetical protein [Gammaproteobacteria bacterium]
MFKNIVLAISLLTLAACATAPTEAPDNSKNLTVGLVQKEIKIGMSGAEVVEVLGSPNMVSTDAERREVWVYDKVATESVSSSSNGWVFLIIAGGNRSSGSSSKTQRTLTIIIKFDDQSRVRDFAYHSSKF